MGALIDADFLPPVAQGDVYRAAQRGPITIGIIDGYFERVPAVWHKEILWAMSRGIHVFGSASMGALRAAELEPFGMIGVGAIFEAFRNEELEDDDEVAVAHGSAAERFETHSEAMVNIRFTLASAEQAGIIRAATRQALLAAGKKIFYADRTYPLLLRRAQELGADSTEIAALSGWLPAGQVNQKRLDAVAMLKQMRAFLAQNPPVKRVRYHLEPTLFWDRSCSNAGMVDAPGTRAASEIDEDRVLDELRLDGTRYRDTWLKTLARVLAADEAQRRQVSLGRDAVQQSADDFRAQRGLGSAQVAEAWLRRNGLSRENFTALAEEEALLRLTASSLAPRVNRRLADALRSSGEFIPLLERAHAKASALTARGLDDAALEHTGLSAAGLLCWYVETFLEVRSPGPVEEGSRRAGFPDVDAFRRAVIREFCYRRELADDATPVQAVRALKLTEAHDEGRSLLS